MNVPVLTVTLHLPDVGEVTVTMPPGSAPVTARTVLANGTTEDRVFEPAGSVQIGLALLRLALALRSPSKAPTANQGTPL